MTPFTPLAPAPAEAPDAPRRPDRSPADTAAGRSDRVNAFEKAYGRGDRPDAAGSETGADAAAPQTAGERRKDATAASGAKASAAPADTDAAEASVLSPAGLPEGAGDPSADAPYSAKALTPPRPEAEAPAARAPGAATDPAAPILTPTFADERAGDGASSDVPIARPARAGASAATTASVQTGPLTATTGAATPGLVPGKDGRGTPGGGAVKGADTASPLPGTAKTRAAPAAGSATLADIPAASNGKGAGAPVTEPAIPPALSEGDIPRSSVGSVPNARDGYGPAPASPETRSFSSSREHSATLSEKPPGGLSAFALGTPGDGAEGLTPLAARADAAGPVPAGLTPAPLARAPLGTVPPAPFQQVAEAVRFHSGDRNLSIRLDPPDLGRVTLDLSFDGTRLVTAVVAAETTDTLSLLKRSADSLMRELEQSGFEGVDLSFAEKEADPRSHDAEGNPYRLLSGQLGNPAFSATAAAGPRNIISLERIDARF